MDFNLLGSSDPRENDRMRFLLQGVAAWKQLDREVRQILPANLHPHIRAACIDGGCLMLLAGNNMAASRVRMLLPSLVGRLRQAGIPVDSALVHIRPAPPAPPQRQNTLRLSEAALDSFDSAAQRLRQQHPGLAAAMSRLVAEHRK
ncbi:MAG: DciA family protein [Neisseria sp.]|nr:DciA family protein [Neisseria sp.]